MAQYLSQKAPTPSGEWPWMQINAGKQSTFNGIKMTDDLDMNGFNILNTGGGGGGGASEIIQLTYIQNGTGLNEPEYSDWDTMYIKIQANQSKGLVTTVNIKKDALNPTAVIKIGGLTPAADSYNLGNVKLVGAGLELGAQEKTIVEPSADIINCLEYNNLKIQDAENAFRFKYSFSANYVDQSSVKYSIVDCVLQSQGVENVFTFLNNSPNQEILINMVRCRLIDGTSVFQISNDGDVDSVMTVIASQSTFNTSWIVGVGAPLRNVINLIVEGTCSSVPSKTTLLTNATLNYEVILSSSASQQFYNDVEQPTYVSQPFYDNFPSVQEALDATKRGVTTLYFALPATIQEPQYPYFNNLSTLAAYVTTYPREHLFDVVIVEDASINLTDVTYDFAGRASFIGYKNKQSEGSVVTFSIISQNVPVLKNIKSFKNIDFSLSSLVSNTDLTSAITSNKSIIFENCKLINANNQAGIVSYLPDPVEIKMTFINCDLVDVGSGLNLFDLGATGQMEIRLFNCNCDGEIILPNSDVRLFYDASTTFISDGGFLAGTNFKKMIDDASAIIYANLDTLVPTPLITNNVSVKEMITAIKEKLPQSTIQFVYRPNGLNVSPYRFNNWTDLMAVTSAFIGGGLNISIVMDDTDVPVTIPSGVWNLKNVSLIGKQDAIATRTDVTLDAGCELVDVLNVRSVNINLQNATPLMMTFTNQANQFNMWGSSFGGLSGIVVPSNSINIQSPNFHLKMEFGSGITKTTQQGNASDIPYFNIISGGNMIVSVINGSVLDQEAIYSTSGPNNLSCYFDPSCQAFGTLSNPANITLTSGYGYQASKIFYSSSSTLVPTPALPSNVTVQEQTSALEALQSDNTVLPYTTLRVQGNASSLTIANDPLTVADIGAQSIGFYGSAPINRPNPAAITAGFVAGAGTPVLDDSTFTGNNGTAAYTIGDIVRALKDVGLLTV